MSNSFDNGDGQDGGSMSAEQVVFLPTVEYYQKTYAGTLDDNDQKAVRLFKDYESHEKVRRLQQELIWVRDGKVKEITCDRLIGKKRRGKYSSYQGWGKLMLQWLAAVKK
jgi:hypothetical protein